MTYRLLSPAREELAAAALWYENQSTGLGQRFLNEFDSVMSLILRFPDAWKPVGRRHRRCRFRRFPYAVLYSNVGSEILVAGVIDFRKDPKITDLRISDEQS